MYLWRKHVTAEWLRKHSPPLLIRYGGAIAVVERPGKRPLVEVISKTRTEAADLRREFGGRIETLPTDWLQRLAKQNATKPLRIGTRLWVDGTKGPNTIAIPAEAAFGTGEHATTAMCLRMLERRTRAWPPGWSMLDAGTGSGILAIAAHRFGAARIIAIDNDPLATSTAARNARINRTPKIEFRTADVLKLRLPGKFDVITANLYSEVLIAALPGWARLLRKDGILILSGVLRSQERSVVAALERNRFRVREARRRGKWVAMMVRRAGKNS
jgi:ribosomal protein L11 methyltransferase